MSSQAQLTHWSALLHPAPTKNVLPPPSLSPGMNTPGKSGIEMSVPELARAYPTQESSQTCFIALL